MKYLLPLLLITGCSNTSFNELERQYFQCAADGAIGCDQIAEELGRRYEIIARREQRQRHNCARKSVVCLSGNQARELFRSMENY